MGSKERARLNRERNAQKRKSSGCTQSFGEPVFIHLLAFVMFCAAALFMGYSKFPLHEEDLILDIYCKAKESELMETDRALRMYKSVLSTLTGISEDTIALEGSMEDFMRTQLNFEPDVWDCMSIYLWRSLAFWFSWLLIILAFCVMGDFWIMRKLKITQWKHKKVN